MLQFKNILNGCKKIKVSYCRLSSQPDPLGTEIEIIITMTVK